ncbi:limonene-1,2-epoxide hydrolase family protein [Nocardia sp. alder85J]|uniref:limonene-1,2-epoxide hydrolase family protein n=1 Tax=Nocardia sp. alder85J TaxID=2862949 RepID=UPI001CD7A316|nr:limonene-1,2-epoxide hydrolase family protein [Nocardia sp. alder85J]MCX4095675.1 nuclear transport factor 2 family protein [Nocardia sp. alder85J]
METAGDTVRRFCAAFASKDTAQLRPYLTPSTVFENIPLPEEHRRIVGTDDIVGVLQAKFAICEEVDFRLLSLAEEGNVVFTERVDYFRFPAGTFPKSDIQEWSVCARWEVTDGKITLWRDYYDVGSNEQQLGVSLPEYLTILERARAGKA